MGWSEAQLYNTSPRYFFHAMRAFQKKQEADLKREENWQRWNMGLTRYALWHLNMIQLDTADRSTITDFFPLPWDEVPKPKDPADIKREADEHIKKMGYDQGIPIEDFFK